jgi:hypothetical protein
MSSWPALFAAALAIWLVLKGPAAKTPSWVQKACRVALAFFLYSGFLYLLKWNPFWKWMLSVDSEPKQGGRLSDPDIDARLAHCDIANPVSGSRFPAHPLRWA